jgi:hypothetical protein
MRGDNMLSIELYEYGLKEVLRDIYEDLSSVLGKEHSKKEKDEKKKDNEYCAALVKSASSMSSKASWRKQKVDRAARHDREIERIKNSIENCKENIARERKRK